MGQPWLARCTRIWCVRPVRMVTSSRVIDPKGCCRRWAMRTREMAGMPSGSPFATGRTRYGLTAAVETFKNFRGVSLLDGRQAVAMGASGPTLRASGVPYDVRRTDPYSVYPEFDFDIAVRPEGDCRARYLVRVEEIRQSLRIIQQALDGLPEGPASTRINMNLKPPAGEAYHHIEGARGDTGCFMVSDGTVHPVRMKWRSPGFSNVALLPIMMPGWKVADSVVIIGSIDIVLGDVDR